MATVPPIVNFQVSYAIIVYNMNNSDLAAERAILSSLFTYGNEAYIEISDIINAKTLTLESNQIIYKIAEDIISKNPEAIIDLPTILSTAHSLGFKDFFDKREEAQHLRAVMNFPVEKTSIRKLAAKIKKLEIARIFSKTLGNVQKSVSEITGDEPVNHILGLVENPIFDLSQALNIEHQDGPKLLFKNLKQKMEYLMDNPVKQMGLSTGYELYDHAIGGGLRDGSVNVICARLKAGKSSFADNVALYQIFNDIETLMLDTEMNEDEHYPRILANMTGLEINYIATGQCGAVKAHREAVLKATDLLESKPYHYLNISGQPFEDTVAEMRRWFHKVGQKKKKLIILDYLKLMSTDPMKGTDMKEHQILGFMATALVNFAQKYKVPVLTFVQLNRDGINAEDTSTISGSDRIGWFASNLTILKRQSDDEISEQHGSKVIYNTKLVPLVSRHGGGLDSDDYINYKFDKHICKFTEGPTKTGLLKNKAVVGESGEIDVTGLEECF